MLLNSVTWQYISETLLLNCCSDESFCCCSDEFWYWSILHSVTEFWVEIIRCVTTIFYQEVVARVTTIFYQEVNRWNMQDNLKTSHVWWLPVTERAYLGLRLWFRKQQHDLFSRIFRDSINSLFGEHLYYLVILFTRTLTCSLEYSEIQLTACLSNLACMPWLYTYSDQAIFF